MEVSLFFFASLYEVIHLAEFVVIFIQRISSKTYLFYFEKNLLKKNVFYDNIVINNKDDDKESVYEDSSGI